MEVIYATTDAAAAKSLQLFQLCDPMIAAHQAPRPQDSLVKNTGVGCHFLLQCMKVKSESEVAQSCLTLRDPMDCSLPGSSIHGIFQARVLEWGATAFLKSCITILTMEVLLCTVFLTFLNLKDVIKFMLIYGRFWELKIKFVLLSKQNKVCFVISVYVLCQI